MWMETNIFMTWPMLVKVLFSLAVILLIHRWIRRLWLSIVLGTLLLAVLTGQTTETAPQIAVTRLVSLDNFGLMAVIFLVIWLSSQMSSAGLLRKMVYAVRRWLGHRHAMAALPAVVGFLPMPGGAIFSAPLVDQCDISGQTEPLLKTQVNYWFRHIWEYWWPLYPGVLLAMHITGLDVWQFMLLGFPLSVVAVWSGYIFLLKNIPVESHTRMTEKGQESLLYLLTPIFIVIGSYTVFRLAVTAVRLWISPEFNVNRYVPMAFGLLLAMWSMEHRHPLGRAEWGRILLSRKTVTLALVVAAVRVYGAFIEATLPTGGTPVLRMQAEMEQWGIPVTAMVMALPFVAGLTTGLGIGFVGASFPIVISLLGNHPPPHLLWAFTILAYASGHMGQMLSPVHVCLVVTNEHFKTNLFHSLRGLFFPSVFVVLSALIFYFILVGL